MVDLNGRSQELIAEIRDLQKRKDELEEELKQVLKFTSRRCFKFHVSHVCQFLILERDGHKDSTEVLC